MATPIPRIYRTVKFDSQENAAKAIAELKAISSYDNSEYELCGNKVHVIRTGMLAHMVNIEFFLCDQAGALAP